MPRLALVLALVSACAPVPIGIIDSASTASPDQASPTVPTGLLCDALPPEEVASLTGLLASVDVPSSSSGICVYNVGRRPDQVDFAVAVRVDDTFEDVASVRSALPGGRQFDLAGRRAYWADSVATLWFELQGAVAAVQIVTLRSEPDDPLALAESVARQLIDAGAATPDH